MFLKLRKKGAWGLGKWNFNERKLKQIFSYEWKSKIKRVLFWGGNFLAQLKARMNKKRVLIVRYFLFALYLIENFLEGNGFLLLF